jgi:hypothetical protein
MMTRNPKFKRHCTLLEEAISRLPDSVQVRGLELLDRMKDGARQLDSVLDPTIDGVATVGPAVVNLRTSFHEHCRGMYEWAKVHTPEVSFD